MLFGVLEGEIEDYGDDAVRLSLAYEEVLGRHLASNIHGSTLNFFRHIEISDHLSYYCQLTLSAQVLPRLLILGGLLIFFDTRKQVAEQRALLAQLDGVLKFFAPRAAQRDYPFLIAAYAGFFSDQVDHAGDFRFDLAPK